MSNFQNTEQTYSISGISANFPAPNPSLAVSRNSGGMVNISGQVFVKSIYLTTVSGFTGASTSGFLAVVAHASSGATSGGGATTGEILFYHYGGASGSTNLPPPSLMNIDFFARSGVSHYVSNSGSTNAYNLNVLYAYKQF